MNAGRNDENAKAKEVREKMEKQESIFKSRFVQVIFLSGVLLQVGIWVRNFAILYYVMEMTNNDPFAVSMISVAEFAPIFIFSIIGGAYADRWRPKRTMVWCDLLSAVSVFVVLLTLHFGTWRAVFFATLVSAILSQFSQPSSMKLFKQHVEPMKIQAAMAMYQTMTAIFMIVGPVLGTFIYQTFGIEVAIGVMGVAFLLSAAVLTMLPADIKEGQEGPVTSVWKDIGSGVRYVLDRPILRTLGGTFFCAGLAVGVMQPLGIFVVTERLGQEADFLQYMMVANGVAMLIGGGLVMSLARKVSPQKLLALGMLVSAIATAVIGMSTSTPLTLSMNFLNGLFFPCIHIGISTLILQSSEAAFVGRVNGVLNPMFMGMMVVSMSTAGWLKSSFSLVTVYEASAIVFLLGALLLVPLFKQKVMASTEA